MATAHNTYAPQYFRVIHPLQDEGEQKCVSQGLRPIPTTRSVRFSLMILRGYMISMSVLLSVYLLHLLR